MARIIFILMIRADKSWPGAFSTKIHSRIPVKSPFYWSVMRAKLCFKSSQPENVEVLIIRSMSCKIFFFRTSHKVDQGAFSFRNQLQNANFAKGSRDCLIVKSSKIAWTQNELKEAEWVKVIHILTLKILKRISGNSKLCVFQMGNTL